ncbi:MAG: hypothetical protein K6A92_06110 [Lachnospiraceae bacterium]|nr:hypothetical protein [Lachnospiraceae bacterium]
MYKIDTRTAEDIEAKIEKLSREFTPEWHFSENNPDIGSTIALIYARQMQENIKHLNRVPEIYHAAFVNFLDLTLKRAVPAGSIVVFKLVDSALQGTHVAAGTLISSGGTGEDGESEVLFATERDLYVTASSISDVFMTDRENGGIIPLKGQFDSPAFFEETETESLVEPEEEEEEDLRYVLKPFVLFGEEGAGSISQFMLGIYHSTVFDVEDEFIFIKLEGNEELTTGIENGAFRFLWLAEEGLKEFDQVKRMPDGVFRLKKTGTCRKTADGDTQSSLVVLASQKPVIHAYEISDIKLWSEGTEKPVDYVGDGTNEMDPARFTPFGDTLAVYAECYIGKEDCFHKPGARVTLQFDLSLGENVLSLTREQEESELKIIKKKVNNIKESEMADTYADEVAIEYFNGIGWKLLRCDKEYKNLFASEKGGKYSLSFNCPYDWAETESGYYHGRLLRVRLLRADNCYMRPVLHHYPVIKGLTVSYSYEGREMRPEKLKSISGTRMTDLSIKAKGGAPFNILMPSDYTDDALYIGFDGALSSGPVGMFVKLQGGTGERGMKCRFEYGTIRGFKQMKVIDGTEGFCHSGIIVFMPPPDLAETTCEGKKRYWMRIVRDEAQGPVQAEVFMAHVDDLVLNAVSVINAVETPEEDFYMDEVVAGYTTYLGSGNILDAEVWVNEKGQLSGEELKNLSVLYPEDVRLEYDLTGNVSSCFIRWHEVEQFPDRTEDSHQGDKTWDKLRCYRLDRLTGNIMFGDGIRCEIPRVINDVSFKVKLRTSLGEAANVPEGSLTAMPEDQMFIDYVTNPVRAYGGSNMETVEEALKRGADMIFSRDRLVSAGDYERAVLRFSGAIDKVAVISGATKEGGDDPSELSLVLLMKDYKEGSFSFHRLEPRLLKYIRSHCELSVIPEKLHVAEPVFVHVSVTVWTEVMNMDDSFEVQNSISDVLDQYLDPISGGGEQGKGWMIGTMPKKPQIIMQLAGIRKQALIRKTSITVRYTDYEGEHECDYDSLKVTPFMVCRSGEHQVNILYDRSELDAQD